MSRSLFALMCMTVQYLETGVVYPGVPDAIDQEAVLAGQEDAARVLVLAGQAIDPIAGCLNCPSELHHVLVVRYILHRMPGIRSVSHRWALDLPQMPLYARCDAANGCSKHADAKQSALAPQCSI